MIIKETNSFVKLIGICLLLVSITIAQTSDYFYELTSDLSDAENGTLTSDANTTETNDYNYEYEVSQDLPINNNQTNSSNASDSTHVDYQFTSTFKTITKQLQNLLDNATNVTKSTNIKYESTQTSELITDEYDYYDEDTTQFHQTTQGKTTELETTKSETTEPETTESETTTSAEISTITTADEEEYEDETTETTLQTTLETTTTPKRITTRPKKKKTTVRKTTAFTTAFKPAITSKSSKPKATSALISTLLVKNATTVADGLLSTKKQSIVTTIPTFDTTVKYDSSYKIDVSFEPNVTNLTVAHGKYLMLKCKSVSSKGEELITMIYKDKEYLFSTNNSSIVLEINNVQKSNEGEYSCHSFNQDRSVYNLATIHVAVKIVDLQISLSPNVNVLKVREGVTFYINCSIAGPFEQFKTILYRNNRYVQKSDNNLTYKVIGAKKSDVGKYVCYGFPVSKTTFQYQQIEVLLDETHEVTAFAHETISLTCSLKSKFPNQTITWTKINSKMSSLALETNGDLTITNATIEDTGIYECSTSAGVKNQVQLNVLKERQAVPEIRTYLNEETLQARLGESIEQTCTSMTNSEDIRIYWYNQNKKMLKNSDKYLIKTLVISRNPLAMLSILTIKNVQKEDFGEYECRSEVTEQPDTARFQVIETKIPELKLSLENKLVTLKEGSTFEFTCSVDEQNAINYLVVSKEGTIIDTTKENSITIRKENIHKLSSEGEYTCRAYFKLNDSTIIESKSIRLLIDTPNQMLVSKDSNVSISCNLLPNDEIVSWQKIDSGYMFKKVDFQTGKLRLKNVQTKDGGEYICESKSGLKNKIDLMVAGFAEFESRSNLLFETITKKPGDSLEQVCTALTNGFSFSENVIIDWYDPKGQKITSNPKYEIRDYLATNTPLSKVSQLLIKSLDTQDFGHYECQISFGFKVNTLTFDVKSTSDDTETYAKIDKPELLYMSSTGVHKFTCNTNIPQQNLTNITWLLNGINVASRKNVRTENNNTQLFIASPEKNFNGYLTCRITYNTNQLVQHSIIVDVIEPVKFSTQLTPKYVNVTFMDHVELKCQASGDFNQKHVAYVWSKDDVELNLVANASSLSFIVSSPEEAGVYSCKAVNLQTNEVTNYTRAKVDIYEDNRPLTIESNVPMDKSNKLIQVKQSDNVTLTCTGGGRLKYKWIVAFNMVKIPMVRELSSVRVYELNKIRVEQSGRYTCVGYSSDKVEYGSYYVDVEVEKYEPIEVEISMIESGVGLTMGCKLLSGYPLPSLEWRRTDNQPIQYANFSYDEQLGLTIEFDSSVALTNDTRVEYECVAVNKFQTKREKINLGHEDKSTTIEATTSTTTIDEETSSESTTSSILSETTTYDRKEKEETSTTTTQYVYTTIEQVEDYDVVTTTEMPIIREIRHIITNDSVVVEQVGWNISIYCLDMYIDTKIYSNVSWFLNENENTFTDKNLLRVISFNYSNEGHYDCFAFEKRTNEWHTIRLTLQVKDPLVAPSAKLEKKQYEVKEDESITFKCKTDGNPRPYIEWLLNGENIQTFANIRINKNTLTLNKVKREYAGFITCRAFINDLEYKDSARLIVNSNSELLANLVIIDEYGKESPKRHFRLGDTVTLKCVYEERYNNIIDKEINIQWLQNNVDVSESESVDLHELTVTFNQTNFGLYMCRAFDRVNRISSLFSQLQIDNIDQMTTSLPDQKVTTRTTTTPTTTTPTTTIITYKDDIHTVKTIVVDSKTDLELLIGSNVDIVCRPFGNLDQTRMRANWYRHYRQEVPNNFQIEGNVLKIRGLKESNDDTYRCVLDDASQTENIFVKLTTIKTLEAPTARIESRLLQFERSQVRCVTSGHPKPTIHWLLNDENVLRYPDYFHSSGNVLVIKTNSSTLGGYLTCRAVREIDNVTAESTSLLVNRYLKAALVEISPKRIEIMRNDQLRIKCELTTSYVPARNGPTYTWFKNNRPIEDWNKMELVLTLKRINDSGVYSCQFNDLLEGVASNRAEVNVVVKKESSVRLVKIKSQTNVISQGQIDVKQGDNLDLTCSLDDDDYEDNDAALTYEWFKIDENEARTPLSSSSYDMPRMSVIRLSTDDRGKYVCRINGQHEDSVMVNVEEYEPIDLDVYLDEMYDQYILVCSAPYGRPRPKLQWLRNNDHYPLVESTSNDNATLEFRLNRFDFNNNAIYTCVARNKFETKRSAIKIDNIPLGPEFDREITQYETEKTEETTTTTEPTTTTKTSTTTTTKSSEFRYRNFNVMSDREIVLEEHWNVYITCMLYREDRLNYESDIQWARFDQRPFEENIVIRNRALTIKNFQQINVGEYECVDANDPEQRAVVSLKVQYPRLEAKIEKPQYQIELGSSSEKIKCLIIHGAYGQNASYLVTEVEWKLNGQRVYNSRILNMTANELVITHATYDMAGELTCKLRTQGYEEPEASTRIEIVTPSRRTRPYVNLVILSNKNINRNTTRITINQYEQLELNCTVNSEDEPIIVNWNKLNDELDREHVVTNENTLVIRDIQPKHAGKYICQAQKVTSLNESDIIETVNVDVLPVDLTTTKTTTTTTTGTTTTESTSTSTLTSTTTTRTTTTARTRRPVRIKMTFNVTYEEDIPLLYCQVTDGDPIINLEIRRQNGDEMIYTNIIKSNNSQEIFLVDDESNYGTYVCEAENDFGIETQKLTFEKQQEPEPEPEPESTTTTTTTTTTITTTTRFSKEELNMTFDVRYEDLLILTCKVADFVHSDEDSLRILREDDEPIYIRHISKTNSRITLYLEDDDSNYARYVCVAQEHDDGRSKSLHKEIKRMGKDVKLNAKTTAIRTSASTSATLTSPTSTTTTTQAMSGSTTTTEPLVLKNNLIKSEFSITFTVDFIVLMCKVDRGQPIYSLDIRRVDNTTIRYVNQTASNNRNFLKMYLKNQPSHYGQYVCRARNAHETSKIIQKVDYETPYGLQTTQNHIGVQFETKINNLINLICSITNDIDQPIDTITIIRSDMKNLTEIYNLREKNMAITYLDLKFENNGEYLCTVQSGNRIKEIREIFQFIDQYEPDNTETAIVAGRPGTGLVTGEIATKLEIQLDFTITYGSEGGFLNCTITNNAPAEYIEVVRLEGNDIQYDIESLKNVYERTHVYLHLPPIIENEGYYLCLSKNNVSEVKRELFVKFDADEDFLSLEAVHGKNEKKFYDMTIQINNYEHQTATLNCSIGRNSTEIVWGRLDGTIRDLAGRHTVDNRQYTIHNLTLADSGDYECLVKTAKFSYRQLFRIVVDRLELPKVHVEATFSTAGNIYNVYARCDLIAGNPKPIIEWRRADLKPLSKRCIVNGHLMHIQDGSAAERGAYQCVARNELGYEAVDQFEFYPSV